MRTPKSVFDAGGADDSDAPIAMKAPNTIAPRVKRLRFIAI
jgi:hypothetical protein